MSGKVGIITGGASGIGLALAKDLHQKGWKLTIVDMNSVQGEAIVADFGEENALFIKADVSKWEENVRFFKVTNEKFGHIDFVAANAGIDDSQNLYSEASTDGLTKPNYKTIEVDLFGPLYASQLALHYFRASPKGGKIVVTSSTAGIYASPAVPQYCTAKFGAIGLVRSMGGNQALKKQNITVNAVCPNFVATGLAPRELLKVMQEKFPHYITPASTIVKAFNMFLEDDSRSGQVAECVLDEVFIREQHPYPDEKQAAIRKEYLPHFMAAYDGKIGHRGEEFADT